MSIWLFRTGKHGEYEEKFLTDNRVYLTWSDLNFDLAVIAQKQDLYSKLVNHYNLDKEKTAINWASQIWPIAHRMEIGDWLSCPLRLIGQFILVRLKVSTFMTKH